MFGKNKTKLSDASKVIQQELEYIRDNGNKNTNKDIWGLGISGGGIRSASVGLGVMQALVGAPGKSILSRMDYLSTVSGGGYIGSALTWFLHKGLPDGSKAGTEPKNFPLGQIGSGARSSPRGNLILDFIRQHGNYLLPGEGINVPALFGITISSMFISLFVYLASLVLLLSASKLIGLFSYYSPGQFWGVQFTSLPILAWLIIAFLVVIVAATFYFSIRTYVKMGPSERYKNQIRGQIFLGTAWKLILISSLLVSLTYVSMLLPVMWAKITAALGSITFGAVIGLFQHKKSVNEKSSGLPTFVIYIAAFILIYGLLLSAYLLSGYFLSLISFLILAAVTLIFGIFVNLNYVGLHRMYRDRLMETFLADRENINSNKWGPATEANNAMLEDMCDISRRPYHLINTNIVLVDSPTNKFRGRGGDSFLMSKLFCGSDATGFIPTDKYMKKGSRGITLPTAMAISGAAVNPNTGSGGRGPTRNVLVSALLGLLNLRLGYWAHNPKANKIIPSPPNFIFPGLKGDLLGGDLTESKDDIQLTDGGHFENLALYELIRRKAKVIIISDAGADENYKFSDLANAIEKVRVDFGVTIRFNEEYNLSKLLPGSSTNDPIATEKYGLAEHGFAVASIDYRDAKGTKGNLILIKSTLTAGLPADIYGYKSANRSFPNQTTANQFFNEEQFEAYRELGYQLTWQMMQSDIAKKILKIDISNS